MGKSGLQLNFAPLWGAFAKKLQNPQAGQNFAQKVEKHRAKGGILLPVGRRWPEWVGQKA